MIHGWQREPTDGLKGGWSWVFGVVAMVAVAPMDGSLNACMYVCMYVSYHICMYVCMYVPMSVCMYLCLYVYIYICVCMYIYI